jgi:hypothetical protein
VFALSRLALRPGLLSNPRPDDGTEPYPIMDSTDISIDLNGDGLNGGDGARPGLVALDAREGTVLHRDVPAIAATDGITINRTKSGISPFVPIVKTPTHSSNSGTLAGYSVEIEDPDADTGYRHVGNVSQNYLLLPNEEVRALAIDIARGSGLGFEETRIFWDGARFAHVIDFVGVEEEVSEGDGVGLSLVTRNSYDKSWRFDCQLMGKRFLCDNGVLSGEFFARVAFKHLTGNSGGDDGEGWERMVHEGMAVLGHAHENLAEFVRGLRLLKAAPLTDARLRDVWKLYPTVGDSIKGQILSRYVEHEEPTLYGLFNAGTNVFWHREKMTSADFANNDLFTTRLLEYAFENLN